MFYILQMDCVNIPNHREIFYARGYHEYIYSARGIRGMQLISLCLLSLPLCEFSPLHGTDQNCNPEMSNVQSIVFKLRSEQAPQRDPDTFRFSVRSLFPESLRAVLLVASCFSTQLSSPKLFQKSFGSCSGALAVWPAGTGRGRTLRLHID